MKYVLELGETYLPGTKDEHWVTSGFYGGYTDKGPVIVQGEHAAYHFPSREYAENVQRGDERLKASRVRESTA